jgi:hypothetical protein
LLALPGLAMADNIRALTVGTVQKLDDHDATCMCWGFSASIRSQRKQINTFATPSCCQHKVPSRTHSSRCDGRAPPAAKRRPRHCLRLTAHQC